MTWFVAIDGRQVESPFAFYRAVLSGISRDRIPDSGVGTDELRERLCDRLARPDRHAVIAIDHHDEPETLGAGRARELLTPVEESVATVAVGQHEPNDHRGQTLSVPAYRDHELVDVITDRASNGLAAGTLDHDAVRELAAWADGNAHDALAALFGGAILATEDDADRIEHHHLESARTGVPDDGVHVGRPLALSETRQGVLFALSRLDATDLPIREIAAAVAAQSSLTAGTVKRFLYELADEGVIERIPLPTDDASGGRQPSTVELRFPSIVFRTLSATVLPDGDGIA